MPTVLITGASGGLGTVLVQAFTEGGWHVCAVGRDPQRLDELREHHGATLSPIVCDLNQPDAGEQALEEVRRVCPKLDALINNAGIQGPMGLLWDTSEASWAEVLRINLLAPVALCRSAIPWMRETGGGSIVNLSGGGATGPRSHFTPYAASKAALVRVTETLAEECAPLGIRVNAVAPGALNTAMLDEVLAAGPDKAGAKEFAAAQRRAAEGGDDPRRAAACIRWLAGPESAPITGRLISAVWDRWETLSDKAADLSASDIYTLRRISAKDRGKPWDLA